MIAALPMYDWDEVRPAMDRFWAAIRDRLRGAGLAAPDRLSRGADLWQEWLSPDLLLGQTCGLPYRTRLHGRVGLVGTLDYGLPDAPPGHYFSQIVVRAGEPGDWTDFIGRRLAINSADSQSGWGAPQNHAAQIGQRFATVVVTGSHRASARAVSEGRADIASIDAVTWRLVIAHDPGIAASLRVVVRTEPTPGVPLITAPGNDSAALFAAVAAAAADISAANRADLGLRGLVRIPAEAYLAVPTPAEMRS